jgi:hypothetical protein
MQIPWLCLRGLLCCRPLLDGCIGRSLEVCVDADAEDIVSTLVAAMTLRCCAFDADAGAKASLVMVTQGCPRICTLPEKKLTWQWNYLAASE